MTLLHAIRLLFVLIGLSIIFGWSGYGWWGNKNGTNPLAVNGIFNVGSAISTLVSLVVLYIVYLVVIHFIA